MLIPQQAGAQIKEMTADAIKLIDAYENQKGDRRASAIDRAIYRLAKAIDLLADQFIASQPPA